MAQHDQRLYALVYAAVHIIYKIGFMHNLHIYNALNCSIKQRAQHSHSLHNFRVHP